MALIESGSVLQPPANAEDAITIARAMNNEAVQEELRYEFGPVVGTTVDNAKAWMCFAIKDFMPSISEKAVLGSEQLASAYRRYWLDPQDGPPTLPPHLLGNATDIRDVMEEPDPFVDLEAGPFDLIQTSVILMALHKAAAVQRDPGAIDLLDRIEGELLEQRERQPDEQLVAA